MSMIKKKTLEFIKVIHDHAKNIEAYLKSTKKAAKILLVQS